LDFGALATGFGLLKMPKMPELKRIKNLSFVPHDIDLNTIAYKYFPPLISVDLLVIKRLFMSCFRDKVREKIRLEKLATYRETGVWPVSRANAAPAKKKEAWSEQKAEKTKKKEKKLVKLENKKKRKKKIDQDEWDELANDVRLMKKFKKRKIKAEDFDKQIEKSTVPDA